MTLTAPLYLLRHGETAWNLERRMQGSKDSALTTRGREQAAAMGRALAAELAREPGPTIFLRSPLGRTGETALIVGRALGLDPAEWRDDPRLAELGYGEWEGFTWAEIEVDHPDALASWRADPEGFCPPGGETHLDLRRRSAALLAEIARRAPARSSSATASAAPLCAASISVSMPAPCSCWKSRRTPSSACSLAARSASQRFFSPRPSPSREQQARRRP